MSLSDCNPVCAYSWTKDGQSPTTGSDLQLTNIQRGQTGVYRCTASNGYGSRTSIDVSVTVNYGPGASVSISPPDNTYTRTEGDTLPDITCTADCRPGCTFVWTKPDNTNFTASAVLSLGQLDRSEHGTYRCTARNVAGESTTTTSVIVTVQYGPGTSITLSPPDTSYSRTEEDTLPDIICTADCRPGCTFVWTKPDNTNFTASAVLSLGQLDRSEHGTYICTARNDIGTSKTTTTVTLQYGPGDSIAFEPMQDIVERVENQTVPNIKCFADCRPPCTYSWSKSGTVRPNPLSLSKVTRTNAGTYTCIANNTISKGTNDWDLIVKFPAEIDSLEYNQGDADVTEHGSKTLICKVESVPSSTITWYYKNNDKQLFTATDVLESSYTLTTAGCLDTGLYTCSARNSVSNTAVVKDIRINVLYHNGLLKIKA
ncbi:carcinoembryonic antigen-related cell adhesion molecule 5-like [Mizuhopecten yessoensis]|uniref:carcinoembryonic antigen-related cell adhesion molecule 5-like n=1 Tax=Mizuhopecten yessoensis TaxID=6573 RepID=UPI000B4596E9|nr:carcinoembryonic antigen-related cell adhesion molecule 5-like [Mizuhopecten yessoensis]